MIADIVAALEARLLSIIPDGAPTDIYKLSESLYKLLRIEDGVDGELRVAFDSSVGEFCE